MGHESSTLCHPPDGGSYIRSLSAPDCVRPTAAEERNGEVRRKSKPPSNLRGNHDHRSNLGCRINQRGEFNEVLWL